MPQKAEWEKMLDFSKRLIIHAFRHAGTSYIDDLRIAVVLLDQATELLMKACIIKNGLSIREINQEKIKDGFRESDKLNHVLDEERTIRFPIALSIVKRLVSGIDKKGFEKFHKLRNEIYHRSTRIQGDKETEIDAFRPVLRKFYETAFDRSFEVDIIDNVPLGRDDYYA